MSQSLNEIMTTFKDHFQFTRRFHFHTPVPADLCVERLEDLPFDQENEKYYVETEGYDVQDYRFRLWTGNRYQHKPHQARIQATGLIRQYEHVTVIEGEVKFALNRMLMLLILSVLMGFWTYGMFTTPMWFLYIFYTGGIPIIAPMYLFWQLFKERNEVLDEIQQHITPYPSDGLTARQVAVRPFQPSLAHRFARARLQRTNDPYDNLGRGRLTTLSRAVERARNEREARDSSQHSDDFKPFENLRRRR